MNFDLSDEQKMLAEQARGLLTQRSSYDHLRKLIGATAEWDEALWRELAELGFLGVNIPEQFGGLGMTELDMGVIMEELGRANAAVPVMSSIILCADAICMAGSEAQKATWLPKLASGEIIGCFANSEGPGAVADSVTDFTDGKLTGTKTPVLDAGIATVAVVLVKGGKLAIVDLNQDGVKKVKLDSFDQLRAAYRLDFDNVQAEIMPGTNILPMLMDRAAVQAAFEATGAAEACLYMARDYVMERQIFGRALASYQAIKHKLADLAVKVEFSRSNAYYAGWAAGESSEDLPAAAAAARLTSLGAYEMGARENLQVHGGIGYTQEANCHFYYRRERMNAVMLGTRSYWSSRLIENQLSAKVKG